jgi:MFS family permease
MLSYYSTLPIFRSSYLVRFSSRRSNQVGCYLSLCTSLSSQKVQCTDLHYPGRLGWSVTCLGTGFMTNVPQFYASRLLTGLFESGMYPALAITLTYVSGCIMRPFDSLTKSGRFTLLRSKLEDLHICISPLDFLAGWAVSSLTPY